MCGSRLGCVRVTHPCSHALPSPRSSCTAKMPLLMCAPHPVAPLPAPLAAPLPPSDEMDEFEQWQTDQAMGAAGARRSGQEGGGDFEGDGDIMDPAEIPLCNEFAATGGCSAGEECCYIHGDMCEVRAETGEGR